MKEEESIVYICLSCGHAQTDSKSDVICMKCGSGLLSPKTH